MFLLINNYQSEETMPYIVSAEKFASYDAAMQAAKDAAECSPQKRTMSLQTKMENFSLTTR